MARPLTTRLGLSDADSVQSFERAAVQRYIDAEALRRSQRQLAAIYLYGYSVEMWVKAAYFRAGFQATGVSLAATIGTGRRRHASNGQAQSLLGRTIGPHEIQGWAELLVAERATSPNPYPVAFANEIVNRATVVYLNWREFMRYRSSRVRPIEVSDVRSEARWFRQNYPAM